MSRKSKKNEQRKRKKKDRLKKNRQKKHDENRNRKIGNNIKLYGRRITRVQFDAYCYARLPIARFTVEEVEWYSLFENRLLACVVRDVTDNDYGFVILGRDKRKLFRAIDITVDFYEKPILARRALANKLYEKYKGKVKDIYPQHDETDKTLELFKNILPEDQKHPTYKVLANEERFEAARNLITEIANSFVDNDGHYEKEFQSVNFQARLWELYLHIYFHNEGLYMENKHVAPDFEVSFFGKKCFIEAVTVNPSSNSNRPDLPPPNTEEEINERLSDYMPIKFGSPLYSKLCKKYWEKDHVRGNPLVFAIHDYHNTNAMTWSRTALSEYLYGVRTRLVNGKPNMTPIETHKWEDKEIPSGFFNQENSEYISAVLFSNQATIPKFNRMGKIAGLGSADVKMIRMGFLYNPDPGAFEPLPFSKDIDDHDYEESWSDGLIMFHNPNALYPVDTEIFKSISHIFYNEETGYTGFHQPFDVLGSMTMVVSPTSE